jgi:hypothetical protein
MVGLRIKKDSEFYKEIVSLNPMAKIFDYGDEVVVRARTLFLPKELYEKFKDKGIVKEIGKNIMLKKKPKDKVVTFKIPYEVYEAINKEIEGTPDTISTFIRKTIYEKLGVSEIE